MNVAADNLDNKIDLIEFEARCLEILDGLVAPGIVVTKEGRSVARITPLAVVTNEQLIGSMSGQISINGDIFSTGLEWDAQS